VSFVIRLSPLHPGYVMTVCASTSPEVRKLITASAVDNFEENILCIFVRVFVS
jgi:hypothetical protein